MIQEPSLMRTVIYTMMRVTAFILVFFILGGPYYTILNAMSDTIDNAGTVEASAWAAGIYLMFYYGFPSLTVFGIIGSVVYMFLVVRRRYYSSEEVYG